MALPMNWGPAPALTPKNPSTAAHKMLLRSTQKLGDGGDDGLLLVFAEFGKNWQSQDFAGGAFGLGEAAFAVAETLESLLLVERDGVVDLRADLAGG